MPQLTKQASATEMQLPEPGADLQTVLDAWHTATVRLEQTHRLLQAEVARLTQELEAKNRELARKNRLADLGQMASHVAHEVRNNLVPVSLYLSSLRRRLNADTSAQQILDKVDAGFTALDATVNDLLHFTSQREPRRETFQLRKLVQEVCTSLAPQLDAQAIEAVIDIPGPTHLAADREMLRRALLNLSLNALEAMPEGGQLVFTSYHGSAGVEIEVADSGPGLDEETLRRALEPFYTTKNSGTGLGLAIVDRIAEAHSGHVTTANCPEGGAAFTLVFPYPVMEAAA